MNEWMNECSVFNMVQHQNKSLTVIGVIMAKGWWFVNVRHKNHHILLDKVL